MHVPETALVLSDIIGDAEIGEIIENQLILWDVGSQETTKYLVRDMPEVVVRFNWDEFQSLAEAEHVGIVHNQLPEYGIFSLPYVATEYNNEIFIVTRKLHGKDLMEVVSPESSEQLREKLDNNWANLAKYALRGRQEGFLTAADVFTTPQYMYGRTCTDIEDDVRLVDLGTAAFNLSEDLHLGCYEQRIAYIAESIVELERSLGNRRLPMARTALAEAAEQGHDLLTEGSNTELRRAHLNAASYMVKHGIIVDMPEDIFIRRFGSPG